MAGDDLSSSRIQPTQLDTTRAQQMAAQQSARGMLVAQEESQEGFQSWVDEGAFNPLVMARRFESLETKRKRAAKEEETEKAEQQDDVAEVQRVEEIGEQYSRKNPELQTRSLLLLRARITQRDTKDEILHKVLEMYPDYSLADEALDFLLQTTDGSLAEEVRLAKEELNANYGREVKAGKNIAEQAREFSKQGLGSPTGLRNLYREITGNPRDSNTLFNELTAKFNYDKMKTVIDFLLHSMGGDLKSRGPSIDRGELHRLLSETRKLQGILGVFRFFKSRMNLILSAFERQGMQLPMRLTFEMLAKQFMKALQERYPSADKILQLGIQLGLSEELMAQVIIFTQMRDGVRQVAPKLYKSDQHRQDLLNAFIDAIEELDERIEEEEEEGEEEEEKEEKEAP
ncbi:MAG: type III secretion system gatekeeper subunit SctW [Verrucomicrobia bacterium]|nr:type III secretion system gatekeeper subunit SctW [Verrucomicrobiota bacterium]